FNLNFIPMEIKRKLFWSILLTIVSLLNGCSEFVETDLPPSQLTGKAVFSDKATATAAIANIYAGLRDKTLITGSSHGLSNLLGHYSDEMDYYGPGIGFIHNFNTHSILATNSEVATLWDSSYNLIYACNSLLEGLNGNTAIERFEIDQLNG